MAAVSSAEFARNTGEKTKLIIDYHDGLNATNIPDQLSAAISPIIEPKNWDIDVPEGAREFTLLLSKGLIRRSGLALKNAEGKYDRVAIYKNKKRRNPLLSWKSEKLNLRSMIKRYPLMERPKIAITT